MVQALGCLGLRVRVWGFGCLGLGLEVFGSPSSLRGLGALGEFGLLGVSNPKP